MLPKVSVGRHYNLEQYRRLVGDELVDEIMALARELAGVRICHVNSTDSGGGVAELLSRRLPLMHSLGISADWRLIEGKAEFFAVTKSLHNALQGNAIDLSDADRAMYLKGNEQSARSLSGEYDVYFVHDPQPAALRRFARGGAAKWIWRCHIDSSNPDPGITRFLKPFIELYDAAVFTMPEFVLPDREASRVTCIAPAIDPFATKNMELPPDLCQRVIRDFGIDVDRPLLVQVSRFDPWKDPLGVIQAYRLVKKQVAGVQLALIGSMAGDDPEGWEILEQVRKEAAEDPDVFVFTNLGSLEVNAFQRGCDVVIQKSIREGFGLVVSEAFWKEKPVVAGNAGGIPMQFPEGFQQYLVETIEQCAERIVYLMKQPGEGGAFARSGREHVLRHFLVPRLVRDELRLIRHLL